MDDQVRDRVLAEARGNPLALLELPRGLSPTQLAGGFGLAGEQAVPARVEESFRRRLEVLPDDTRSLMLLAAAEPVGDAALLWRAAERLGIGTSAAVAAEANGLLEIGTRVRFRHPLVRSAVYRAASLPERQAAHLALAEVTDCELDPDRRAWHLAAAAPGADEEVAAELERSADRARARGGVTAAAAFLQRSVELTSEPAPRAGPLDIALARETYLDAWVAAMFAGGSAPAGTLHEASRAARSARQPAFASRPSDLLLDGLALLVIEGRAAAASTLRRAARSFAESEIIEEGMRWAGRPRSPRRCCGMTRTGTRWWTGSSNPHARRARSSTCRSISTRWQSPWPAVATLRRLVR
jgi:hypothetical protein